MDQPNESPTDHVRDELLARAPAWHRLFVAEANGEHALALGADVPPALRQRIGAWCLTAQTALALALLAIHRGEADGPEGKASMIALEGLAAQHDDIMREMGGSRGA